MKIFVDFIALGILYFFRYFGKWKEEGRDVLLVNTTMYIYLSFVLFFTLMPILTALPFIFNHPYTSMNMVPFIDVTLGRGDFVRQVVLNVILTVPFGFLFPLVKRNSKFLKTVLYTFLLSLCIELLQPLINGFRSADVTDLITNVLGGCLGYAIYLLFKPLVIRIIEFIKNK